MKKCLSCVLRVDAGGNLGMGHFRRCLVLAKALRATGYSVVLLMASVPESLLGAAKANQIKVVEYGRQVVPGSREDAELFGEYVNPGEYDWLVFDGYHFKKPYRNELASFARHCLIIHDSPGDYRDADILLDQNVGVNSKEYLIGEKATFLYGPEHALVDGNSDLRDRRFSNRNRKPRILVTMGGADVKQLTWSVVGAIVDRDVHVDVVLGALSPWRLPDFERYSETLHLHVTPDGLDELIANADVGVMSLGITTWEMCFYGLPFVMLESNANQRRVIRWFENSGVALNGLFEGQFASEHFRRCVDRFIQNPAFRRSCSKKLLSIVDGDGPKRVIAEMMRKADE